MFRSFGKIKPKNLPNKGVADQNMSSISSMDIEYIDTDNRLVNMVTDFWA